MCSFIFHPKKKLKLSTSLCTYVSLCGFASLIPHSMVYTVILLIIHDIFTISQKGPFPVHLYKIYPNVSSFQCLT